MKIPENILKKVENLFNDLEYGSVKLEARVINKKIKYHNEYYVSILPDNKDNSGNGENANA